MLSTCSKCELTHVCPGFASDAAVWKKSVEDSIINMIPQDSKLSTYFVKWSTLDKHQRAEVIAETEKQIFSGIITKIIKCLCSAFTQWEKLQDDEGAPGVVKDKFCFTCDPGLQVTFNIAADRFGELVYRTRRNEPLHEIMDEYWD